MTHLKEVVQKSFLSGIFLFFAAFLQFGFTVVVARKLGADEAGVFFLSFSIVAFLAIIARFGLDMSIVRFGSPLFANKDRMGLIKLARDSLILSVVAGAVFSALLFGLSNFIAQNIFIDIRLSNVLRIASFSIIPLILSVVFAEILRAQKLVVYNIASKHLAWLIPAIALTATLAKSLSGVTAIYVTSMIIGSVLAGLFTLKTFRKIHGSKKASRTISKQLLIKSSLPLLIVVLSGKTMQWMDTLFLGALADSTSVSLYNAAVQISFAVSLILLSFNTINASKFAQLYDANKINELKKLYLGSARIISLIALPLVTAIILFRGSLLGIFGNDFSDGSTAVIIVVLAQFINVSVGSVAYLLAMTDQSKLLSIVTVFANVLNIILNIVLIPRYGLEGAAIATGISLVVRNVILLLFVRRYFERSEAKAG